LMKEYPYIKVFITEGKSLRKNDISWLVKQIKDKEYEIYLNKDESVQRMAFTLAHELWHIILDHFHEAKENDFFIDVMNRDSSSISGLWNEQKNQQFETEANYFAACLLMPEEEVKKQWKISPQISELSRYFNVSEAAMSIRIMNLWLLNNKWA